MDAGWDHEGKEKERHPLGSPFIIECFTEARNSFEAYLLDSKFCLRLEYKNLTGVATKRHIKKKHFFLTTIHGRVVDRNFRRISTNTIFPETHTRILCYWRILSISTDQSTQTSVLFRMCYLTDLSRTADSPIRRHVRHGELEVTSSTVARRITWNPTCPPNSRRSVRTPLASSVSRVPPDVFIGLPSIRLHPPMSSFAKLDLLRNLFSLPPRSSTIVWRIT